MQRAWGRSWAVVLCSREDKEISVAESLSREEQKGPDIRWGQTVRDLRALVKTLAPTPREMGGLGHRNGTIWYVLRGLSGCWVGNRWEMQVRDGAD